MIIRNTKSLSLSLFIIHLVSLVLVLATEKVWVLLVEERKTVQMNDETCPPHLCRQLFPRLMQIRRVYVEG